MPRTDFVHVEAWVFDLDNTLYPAEVRLFDQIERRMTDYVMRTLGVGQAEANRLRRVYWERHGTTLAGLMREHAIDPEPYLADVHDIDLTGVPPSAALRVAIGRLPGRKIVYTNGSREHARRVTAATASIRGAGRCSRTTSAISPSPTRSGCGRCLSAPCLSATGTRTRTSITPPTTSSPFSRWSRRERRRGRADAG